jgi:hypothetical protein
VNRESAAFFRAHVDQLQRDALLLLEIRQGLPKLLQAQICLVHPHGGAVSPDAPYYSRLVSNCMVF